MNNENYVVSSTDQNAIKAIVSTSQTIVIPAHFTKICTNSLSTNTNTQFIFFEKDSQLSALEENAFSSTHLIFISLRNCLSLTFLPKWCFSSCKNLHSCLLPDSLTEISYGAFCNTTIEVLSIPTSLSKMSSIPTAYHAPFHSCRNITSFSFPVDSHLEILEQRTFWGCSGLKNLVLPPSKSCSSLLEYQIIGSN